MSVLERGPGGASWCAAQVHLLFIISSPYLGTYIEFWLVLFPGNLQMKV